MSIKLNNKQIEKLIKIVSKYKITDAGGVSQTYQHEREACDLMIEILKAGLKPETK